MKVAKAITMIGSLFISLPIWAYLIYSILKAIHPDRLVWFLFWVYVPALFLISIISNLAEEGK